MAPPFPSIQSFFHADTVSSPTKSELSPVDDGFTAAEVENALHPTLPEWRPRGEYEDVDIGAVVPGKGSVSIMGRVVNFHDSPLSGKAPHSAQGCVRLLVQDDTGLLAVCLYMVLIHSMLMIDNRSSYTTSRSISRYTLASSSRSGLPTSPQWIPQVRQLALPRISSHRSFPSETILAIS